MLFKAFVIGALLGNAAILFEFQSELHSLRKDVTGVAIFCEHPEEESND